MGIEITIYPYQIKRNGFNVKVLRNNRVMVNRIFTTVEDSESYFKLMADVARFLQG